MQEKTGSEGRIFLFARLFLCFLGARILLALPLFLPLPFRLPKVIESVPLCQLMPLSPLPKKEFCCTARETVISAVSPPA